MSENIICNAFRDIALGRFSEVPDHVQELMEALTSGPRRDSVYYLCVEIVKNDFRLNDMGKKFALYASGSESLASSIDYRPPGSQVVSRVTFNSFIAYGVREIDWSYIPKGPLAPSLEVELWSRWLSLCPADSFSQTDTRLFQNAFETVGGSLLFAIRKEEHDKMQKLRNDESINIFAPLRCLESLKKTFPALFAAPKESDVSRTEAALGELKLLVPDFDLNDVVFGRHYEYFVADTQERFNKLYIRVLLSRVFFPSYPETKMPSTVAAAELYHFQKALRLDSFLELLINGEAAVMSRSTWQPLVSERQQAQFASQMFVNLLRSMANKYKKTRAGSGTIYSPYVPVCNSSGVGKTRLALSTGYSCITIFICLRPEDDKLGYPARSLIADYLLKRGSISSRESMTKFLLACLLVWVEVFQEWIIIKEGITRKYGELYKTKESNFLKIMCDIIAINTCREEVMDIDSEFPYHQIYWTRVEEKHKELLKGPSIPSRRPAPQLASTSSTRTSATTGESLAPQSASTSTEGTHATSEESVSVEEAHESLTAAFKTAAISAQILLQQHKLLGYNQEVLIVPVFDEARYLLPSKPSEFDTSLFRYLRLGCCQTEQSVVVLTDTLSTVWNFTPPRGLHHSAKESSTPDLFPPVISIPLLDVIKCRRSSVQSVVIAASGGYSGLSYDPLDDIDKSRPMYPAAVNRALEADSSSNPTNLRPKILTLAKDKLVGPLGVTATVFEAILVVKLGVPFLPSVTNTQLMASHMGLATFLSEDREDVVVSYQGEPMASQGATAVLHGVSDHLSKTVDCLYNSLSTQALVQSDVGGVGEILAAFYCVVAQDKCLSKQYTDAQDTVIDYLRPRLCEHFLSTLLPQSSLEFLGKDRTHNGILMNSFVTFACFVPMLKPLSSNPQILVTKRFLLWALESRVAFYLPPNTKGIDLVIPVITGAKGSTPLSMSLDNVGAIVIQVKNLAKYPSKNDLESIMGKMWMASSLFESGIPILLGILMNVGSGGLGSENPDAINDFVRLENPAVKAAFPIVSVSGTMMQGAIGLDKPIKEVLNKIGQIPSGPEDQVWRTYHSETTSPAGITELTCHVHPQYRLRLPLFD